METDFGLSYISENVQFEWVALPSKGECYPHKKDKLPVAYLTAHDENVIVSPRLRREKRVADTLLSNKVLDKAVNVEDLCIGDREAILLWLRRTGYGDEFKFVDSNGNERIVNLSSISFREFNYFGDMEGHFDYQATNGERVKYRLLTHRDEREIIDCIIDGKMTLDTYMDTARLILSHCTISVNEKTETADIKEWLDKLDYKALRTYLRFVQFNSPVAEPETLNGLEIGDELFYDIK